MTNDTIGRYWVINWLLNTLVAVEIETIKLALLY